MSLSDLAALGSFVSGIAVVVSFVFLAFQIRQSNRNQRSLMQQGRTERNVNILLALAEPSLAETVAAAHRNCATLPSDRIWSFYGLAAAVFWSYEDSFIQYKAGTLDARSWESDVATIRRLLASPAYRVVWKLARDGMSGGYRDWLDSVMRDVPVDTKRSLNDLWSLYTAQELAGVG